MAQKYTRRTYLALLLFMRGHRMTPAYVEADLVCQRRGLDPTEERTWEGWRNACTP